VHDVTTGAGVGGGAVMSNTGLIGKVIYTDYIFAFEIAGLILLVAIIAAIALTLRRRKDSKYQNPSDQVRVRAADRMRLVKMDAFVEAPDPVPATDAAAAPVAGEKK
jgi:NADH-quinone oxidoreductase subunit J